ncbi:hypothetical protein [Enterococcus gilvus]|jgi:hypothetical protein|uniref:Uncharacterized protein n=1 Tax=Enterococcus gilvus ATCC BAA-350 TaxID=1158614 RepID=R2VGK7_9ENTE|nr:hypothetical protein [Enterococcus gilvus]AXG39259.1 hypothetical protein EGCR1_11380 [Enterococcus gilvus]EOI56910.1 hypothetical protein UKC_01095 [Enterococcus gilvus ATCC BAA-350]EOW83516.1 hypothetical protein I592_02875 [Enterococcus gilvus ATCC BAA-350]MBS5819635.1 hypothetical protein [Enterococcus gilvus]OJG42534.1 hypothetical protein RV02_GL003540 [Enterococcus gilvus]
MHEHEIVPPIQPADVVDDGNTMQQVAQAFLREDQQENIEIKKGKNDQEVFVVIADPAPVTFELENDLAMKEKRKIKGAFVEIRED